MRKPVRRLLLVCSLLLALAALFGTGGVALIQSAPEFYRPLALTPEQLEAAARSAEDKIVTVQNQAAEARREELDRARTGSTRPGEAINIAFTDDELNSLFAKWSEMGGWKARYGKYMTDPVVIIQDQRLIFAATVKVGRFDAVLSLHFNPRLDETGKLLVDLDSVRAGKLPLPQEALISPFRTNVQNQLMTRFRAWQNFARLDASGTANPDAVKVVMTRLVLGALNREPCEPMLFLPVVGSDGVVPVKLTGVAIEENCLKLTVVPLTSDERTALMSYIREPFQTAIVPP